MSYKLRSLAYLVCFVVAISAYYNFGDEETVNEQEIIDLNKMNDDYDNEKLVIVNDLELE